MSERFCGRRLVGTPDDFKSRPLPKRPEDLTGHRCINLRHVTRGGYFPGSSKSAAATSTCADSDFISVRVERQLAVNSLELARSAALDGLGLAYLREGLVEEQFAKKQLVQCWQIGANLSPATTSILK